VPDGVYEHFQQGIGKRGKEVRDASVARFTQYLQKYPDQGQQLIQIMYRRLPDGWDKNMPTFPADAKGKATRDSGSEVLNAFAKNIPWLIGGAADLAPSTKTLIKGAADFEPNSLRRPQLPLWHPRTRDGCGLEWDVGVKGAALRGNIPDLQRLHEKPDASRGADGSACDLRVHARLDRSWRRRTDAPVHRATRGTGGPSRTSCCCAPADANEVVEAWRIILEQTHHRRRWC